MQLVAYGAQDLYLTANSQITFFKVVHRRHTNFSMESIEQTFSGTADFGKKVTVTVARNADLISKVYLRATLPAVSVSGASGFKWIDEVGHFLIKSVEVEVGGQRIDKHYGTWLSIWSSLTTTQNHLAGYNKMIGNVSTLTTATTSDTSSYLLHIPMRFWFCRHIGLALPLIALQYHEVKINIDLFHTLYVELNINIKRYLFCIKNCCRFGWQKSRPQNPMTTLHADSYMPAEKAHYDSLNNT